MTGPDCLRMAGLFVFFLTLQHREGVAHKMSFTARRLFGVFVLSLVWGCSSPSQQSTPKPVTIQSQQGEVAYQRFVPVGPDSSKQGVPWVGFFALDTKTGQLCRTADWEFKEQNWATIPTCYSLYESGTKKAGFTPF